MPDRLTRDSHPPANAVDVERELAEAAEADPAPTGGERLIDEQPGRMAAPGETLADGGS